MSNQIILTPIPKQELINEILSGIREILSTTQEPRQDSEPEYLDGSEVEKLLKISNVTRYNWEKKGILTGYKIGTRRRYLRSEVLDSIKQVDSKLA